MRKKPTDGLTFGALSAREFFYFVLAIGSLAILVFIFTVYWNDLVEAKKEKDGVKYWNSRMAARAIGRSGGYPISETKVLYYDYDNHRDNPWRIYDTVSDEISDGSYLARAFDQAGPFREALANPAWLSGWNGDLLLATTIRESQGYSEQLIFQWTTNIGTLRVFKWADFSDGQKSLSMLDPSRVASVENGWLYSVGFFTYAGPIMVIGNRVGPRCFANPFPKNLLLASSWPFQDGLYVTAMDTNNSAMAVYVLSLTNQAIIFSNPAVKLPIKFDFLEDARPDPSGKRVIWTFVGDSKEASKLRAVLPSFIRSGQTLYDTLYYYSSDLHATKFHFICSVKNPDADPLLLGVNGDSIWLPDAEKGIRRYDLK